MTEIEASRTLVKSPPELWAECSEASTLARHLGQFGEIKITRLEPESTVAWEGTLASGTVRLEPSGWGTKVILTAQELEAEAGGPVEAPEATVEPEAIEPGPNAAPAPVPEPEYQAPVPEPAHQAPVHPPATHRRGGLLGRLFGRWRSPQPPVASVDPGPAPPAPKPEPVALTPKPVVPEPVVPEPVMPEPVAPEPVATGDVDPEAVLIGALDSLGQAHHRPFSRG
jgi:hypothetical protein